MAKEKVKKISAKKEKYAKFNNKEKSGTLDLKFPELDDDSMNQKRRDEEKFDKFVRFNRNRPAKEIVERRMKSKR
ncbi:hypothetical protein C0585_08365 [Candidatus Woesearchaeota archaeon]|nr:MAG: hypothetical protein C0585_08365 [Candidatus Woesearchaeota archaeon]